MIYTAHNSKTNETIKTTCPAEFDNLLEEKGWWHNTDVLVYKYHHCRGCGEDKTDTTERKDFYGITTGHYCDDCYENNYPYRKDRYPTMEYDGYGECLGLDED